MEKGGLEKIFNVLESRDFEDSNIMREVLSLVGNISTFLRRDLCYKYFPRLYVFIKKTFLTCSKPILKLNEILHKYITIMERV